MAPAELEAAVRACPVAYLPLGSLEFHSAHLPIGLDALNAHGVCVGAAMACGGVVLPPVYQGVGGGHSDYPWTIMMTSAAGVRAHLEHTLARLEHFGFRLAVIFTGHFAPEQLAMIDEIASAWRQAERTMDVLATGVNRCETAPLAPDHAGLFETTLLHSFWPDLVHLERLPSAADHPGIDPHSNPMGDYRHDPRHPLWGIFGPDPRGFDPSTSAELSGTLVAWLANSVSARLTDL
nr:creatininase family protein [Cryobacterium roopkundense]